MFRQTAASRHQFSSKGSTLLKRICWIVAMTALTLPALAAAPPGPRMWNLTPETMSDVRFAPSGTVAFGPNQCVNDKDGAVDFDERLRITNVPPGRYDLRLRDVKSRVCMVRNVAVPAEGVFAIDEKDLVECAP